MENEKLSMQNQSDAELSEMTSEHLKYFTSPENEVTSIFKQASLLDDSGSIVTSDSTDCVETLYPESIELLVR